MKQTGFRLAQVDIGHSLATLLQSSIDNTLTGLNN
jgi:hypothetical protein